MTKKETDATQGDGANLSVYQAISEVQKSLAREGISKDRTSGKDGESGPKFKFRGIDDVYNTISSLLAEAGLCILPRLISRETSERKKPDGKMLYFVAVEVEYDLVSSHDGSKHTIKVPGEAMDSGDKATNKAMSAAYKYACLQTFCIPTEGDNDADATSHEVAAKESSVFETKDVREKYVSDCIAAIGNAKTVLEVKNQRITNTAKWGSMKSSDTQADVDAFNKIVAEYNAAFAAKSTQEKATPKTVEGAKQQVAQSPLIDDEIPF